MVLGEIRSLIPQDTLNQPLIVYSFEGNPHFNPELMEMEKTFNKDHTIILLNEHIVSTYDGFIDFYLDTNSKQNWGSSLNKNHPDILKTK